MRGVEVSSTISISPSRAVAGKEMRSETDKTHRVTRYALTDVVDMEGDPFA
tara:strand:- start:2443 stop:2595 length:153 start_codon:yes stop_codon:yes gene_type:complete